MSKPERRDLAKEKHWRRLLRQWRRSGLTGRDFCAAHHLGEASFYAWRREIARRDHEAQTPAPPLAPPGQAAVADRAASTFVELAFAATAPAAIEVVLGQGRVLRVGPGFDADLLRQLVRVLEVPAC